jgi:2,4-dienoyl-CoA reductase-like NADH-dependent reductase (Old Yellow Enzyme family)
MAEVANRIHKAGGKAFLQLSHGGNLCSEGIIGETPVGPSDIPQWPGQTVRALTTEEVYKIADNFGKAIARAKAAGFDGVELHSCHGSMMLQFCQNCIIMAGRTSCKRGSSSTNDSE